MAAILWMNVLYMSEAVFFEYANCVGTLILLFTLLACCMVRFHKKKHFWLICLYSKIEHVALWIWNRFQQINRTVGLSALLLVSYAWASWDNAGNPLVGCCNICSMHPFLETLQLFLIFFGTWLIWKVGHLYLVNLNLWIDCHYSTWHRADHCVGPALPAGNTS